MEFMPKSEQELWEESLLPVGEYDFEVVSAEAKLSKAGNDMIELQLHVFPNNGGSPRKVRDWLMSSMGFKLRHFCYGCGLEAAYENGTLADMDCGGRAGRLKLGIQENDRYGKQNSVKDYVVPSSEPNPDELPNADPPPPPKPQGVPTAQARAAKSAAVEEDIPF